MSTTKVGGPVVVGVDGSRACRVALDLAAELAIAFDVELIVVHSVGLTAQLAGDIVPANQHLDELSRLLHGEWTAPLSEFGSRLRWRAELVWGGPSEVLVSLAEQCDASFVVVGSRGHRQSGPGLLGSTSHHVVHHCQRPVVVVRDPLEKEN